MKRFLIHTFGCQMNAHDSRRIAEVLERDGYLATDALEQADLIVLNTCSVREKAEHKLRSALGKLRPLKQERSDLVIAVAGCMAQEHGAALLERLDLVDVLIGPDNVPELPGLLRQVAAGGPARAHVELDLVTPRFLTASPRPGRSEVTAYVTVMKGCDERCSFCIVPYTRGAERYRSADEIVAEIDALVAGGVREITLLGQTVNSWHEPGAADPEGRSRFAELLYRIAVQVPELARLRYTSPHPRHVTPELVAAHAELALLPAHVHLPVQSGSDRVLKRMIRRYSRQSYLERARALQAARPGLTLATDIIVGFPGETEEDYAQTLSLVEEVGFAAAFGFKYSPRPHTPARKLDDDVSEEVKTERLARLFARCEELQQSHLRSLVGTYTRVLIEGPSPRVEAPLPHGAQSETRFAGYSDRHEIVHVDAPAGYDLTGCMLDVHITQANKRSLLGQTVGGLPARTPSPARAGTKAGMRLPVVAQ
jgi:tRNA-2-methylthio-N6-dimethylallyladenosine synthase